MGKSLSVGGMLLVACGLLVTFGDRLPFRLGQLPGDLTWRGRNSTVHFPIVTCLLLSGMGSLLLWLFSRRQ